MLHQQKAMNLTGSKSSFRIINGPNFAGHSHQYCEQSTTDAIGDYLDSPIVVKTWNDEEFKSGILKWANQIPIHFINQAFIKKIQNVIKQDPTCGIVGILLALPFASKISLFGFTFFKDDWDNKHYYEKITPYSQDHNFSAEEKLVHQLVKKQHQNILNF